MKNSLPPQDTAQTNTQPTTDKKTDNQTASPTQSTISGFPRSMTAFGRGEAGGSEAGWVVEIRSVNHRFADIKIRLPRQIVSLEERVRKLVSGVCNRGHIEVSITPQGLAATSRLSVNLPLAREYMQGIKRLRDEFGLKQEPELNGFLTLPDIFLPQDSQAQPENEWPLIKEALNNALSLMLKMREAEGQATKNDLLAGLKKIRATCREIIAMAPGLVLARQQRLQQRLAELIAGRELDPIRLEQEAAIIADKSDISEELARLESHFEQFEKYLALQEPVGRRLDFLLQEFFREINTIASKINDSGVAGLSIELKNEVEKLREQVQNLE